MPDYLAYLISTQQATDLSSCIQGINNSTLNAWDATNDYETTELIEEPQMYNLSLIVQNINNSLLNTIYADLIGTRPPKPPGA